MSVATGCVVLGLFARVRTPSGEVLDIPVRQVRASASSQVRSSVLPEPPMRIADAMTGWERQMRAIENLSETHVRKSLSAVKRIADDVGWHTIDQITGTGLLAWAIAFIEKAGTPGARATARNMTSQLRAFCGYLKSRGLLKDNPLQGVKLPRVKRCDRGPGARAFTIEDVRRLIAAAEQCEATDRRAGKFGPNRSVLYCVLTHTGIRYSEAMRLTWPMVDLEADTMTLIDKSARGDWIPVAREAIEALRRLAEFQALYKPNPGDRVFRRVSHHALVDDMERAKILGKLEGRGGQWHRFRKLSITERLRRGVQPIDVQRLARHRDLGLTLNEYRTLEVDELRPAAEALGQLGTHALNENGR